MVGGAVGGIQHARSLQEREQPLRFQRIPRRSTADLGVQPVEDRFEVLAHDARLGGSVIELLVVVEIGLNVLGPNVATWPIDGRIVVRWRRLAIMACISATIHVASVVSRAASALFNL